VPIPRLAFWFGPLAAMNRLPAIHLDKVVTADRARVVGRQDTVGGVPRRDVLAVRGVWAFEWARLLREEWAWIDEMWQAGLHGSALPDLYLRSPHEANLLPSSSAPFLGTPTIPGQPPSPAAMSWFFNNSLGRRTQTSLGRVPCEAGEQLVARAFVRANGTLTTPVNVGLRTVDAINAQTDTVSAFTAPANSSPFLDVAATVTVPAGAVYCQLYVSFTSADGRVALPRITRVGEPGTWTPAGGSARVVMDDFSVRWVSPTEADVTLRLIEAGVA
jgi:hypothetical protein